MRAFGNLAWTRSIERINLQCASSPALYSMTMLDRVWRLHSAAQEGDRWSSVSRACVALDRRGEAILRIFAGSMILLSSVVWFAFGY